MKTRAGFSVPAAVINIGNMLEVWSGGRLRSTLHRVHPPPGEDRYSLAYFVHPKTGSHAGVLIWPDAFGLRPAMKQMAERLADPLDHAGPQCLLDLRVAREHALERLGGDLHQLAALDRRGRRRTSR